MKRRLGVMLVLFLGLIGIAGAAGATVNVALNKEVVLNGTFFQGGWNGYPVAASTATDGYFFPSHTTWDQGSVWWNTTYAPPGDPQSITINLGGVYLIGGLIVQADDNDSYDVRYWDDTTASWQLAWTVPHAWGGGTMTRPNSSDNTEQYILATPILTTTLNIKANSGDNLYSVAEVQAFGDPIVGPVAIPGGPYWTGPGSESYTVTLDGSGSYHTEAPNKWIVAWDWYLDGSLLYKPDPQEPTITIDSPEIGDYVVCLRVTANDGIMDTRCTTLHVTGIPTATIIQPAADISVYKGDNITFEGSTAANIVEYAWYRNGVRFSSQRLFSYDALPVGDNTITYRVRDNVGQGRWSNDSLPRLITVLSQSDRVDLAIEAGDISFWQGGTEVTYPMAGTQVEIRVVVHNLSTMREAPPTYVCFNDYYQNQTGKWIPPNCPYTATSIPPGGTAIASFIWDTNTTPLEPGYHVINANVAAADTENYDPNNHASRFIMLEGATPPTGNLVIDDYSYYVSPNPVSVGNPISVQIWAYYAYQNGTDPIAWMTPVMGAEAEVTLEGQTIRALTDTNGNFNPALTLSAPLQPGIYTIHVNLSDGTLTGNFSYQVEVYPVPDPDLVVTDIRLLNAIAGQAETVRATVCNVGGVDVTQDFQNSLQIYDYSGDPDPITPPLISPISGGLAAHACTTVDFMGWTPPESDYYRFVVKADDPPAVPPIYETDKNNNSTERKLFVYTNFPDLWAVELKRECSIVSVHVINKGGVANNTCQVTFYADYQNENSPSYSTVPLSAVTPKGADYPARWVAAAPYGETGVHRIRAVVVCSDDPNPSNNQVETEFDFTPKTDVAVTDIYVNGAQWGANLVYLNVPATLDAEVKNVGCVDVTNVTVNFKFQGDLLDTQNISNLIVGDSTSVHITSFTFTNPPYPAGTDAYTVESVLAADEIPANNLRLENLTVALTPVDYKVEAKDIRTIPFDSTHLHPSPGETYKLRAKVCNKGSFPAMKFESAFYEEGISPIGVRQLWDLSPDGLPVDGCMEIYPTYGQGSEFTTYSTATPGTTYIVVSVSPVAGDQDDTDDSNNSATQAISINQPPVAVITIPGEKTSYQPGETVPFDGTNSHDALDVDGLGEVVDFAWDFGDGQTATGATAPHAFTAEQDYTVTLTVTDNNGATASVQKTVSVQSQYTLAVTIIGQGSVTLNPPGGTYLSGTSVTLTPDPAAGWRFDRWEGDLTGTDNPATLLMNGNKSVTAVFEQLQYTLTITIIGQGSVTLNPPGGTYLSNTTVTLTPDPAAGWRFDHWEGDLSGTTIPGTVLMDRNKAVTAVFARNQILYLSFLAATTVPNGVGSVQNEDIVAYNIATGTWSLYFDGSDVGLSSFAIDALAVLPNGDLLISLDNDGSLPGLIGGPSGTTVDDSDIIRFTPSSLGANTTGTWNFYFDGSDVGLTATAEDIDALEILADGSLVISTTGNPSVTGLSSLASQDLIRFTPTTLGAATTGTWSYYYDGSDVAMSNSGENVDAVTLMSTGSILLSTTGAFSVTGVSGADEDVLRFNPTQLGATTSGTYQMYLDLSTLGIATSANLNAIDLVE